MLHAVRRCICIPVAVVVGTDRHLHAEEMADETVKASKHPGLDIVAALFLAGAEGRVHVSADVTIDIGVLVDVTVVVVSLRAP